MEILIEDIPKISWITVMPLLLIFLKTTINSFNMTTVERSILTDFKQIGIYSSQIFLFSLVSGIMLFVYLILTDNLKEVGLILGLFTSIITMLTVTIIVFSFVITFIRFFSIKVCFFINEKDTGLEWKIERRISKTKLLVSREENIFKFFDAKYVMEQEITRKLEYKKNYKILWHDKIVNYGITVYTSLLISIILLLSINWYVTNVSVYIGWQVTFVLLLLLTYIFTLYVFVVLNNDKVIKKFDDSSEQ